jgi:RNA-directed DNA polymerase
MHENRETSQLPERSGRFVKAQGRKTDMNGGEESDSGVVPMKDSNERGIRHGRRSPEGRPLNKENMMEQHTTSTPSGDKDVLTGLQRVRRTAEEKKQERFTSLLHHVTMDLLRESFLNLKRTAAAGVDGVTWKEYEKGLEDRLKDLHGRVHRGAYRAQPSRRIYIPKADGRKRPIGIAAVEDKIVQQAVVTVLNEIYEADFLGFSYGFRPGRSPHRALDALSVGIVRRRVNWILDADIRGFFDNMSHEWIERFIQHRIADPRMLRLIRKWLRAGVSEDGEWSETKIGTPQGAVVSPLLANVYLHYAFDLWVDAWREKIATGDLVVVRYADDLVVGFQHKHEAERFLMEFKERLAKFGLELHGEKTRLIEFGRYAAENRTKRGEGKPDSFTFLGFTHLCGKRQKTGTFTVIRRTDGKRLQRTLLRIKQALHDRMHETPADTGAWLKSVLLGYYRYFAVPGNTPVLGVFRYRVQLRWRRVLQRRSQTGRFNWRRFGRLSDRWLPHPKLVHPFPEQRFNALHPS